MKQGYVYIMTNAPHGTLYIGVTSDLIRRLYEHKNGLYEGFTKKYQLKQLVYFETSESIEAAIEREKKLKNWHRDWKIDLINTQNPDWTNLSIVLMDPESSSG
jgi:putative endonuclease